MSEKRTVVFSEVFPRILKELRKKYRRIDADVDDFADILERGETPGDRLQGTDDYIVYKARIASRDMQRGKSGGFRALYYLQTETHIMF
jgi:mRNA-degrading endonuclease RelE of RelBE toxin-antitoxin system